MSTHVRRSIDQPIREGLSWNELWLGSDKGLICCWENGRRKRLAEPQLAARVDAGELVVLGWKGGVADKLAVERKAGSLNYLATWQGLRGEDLDVVLEEERVLVCSKTRQAVAFSAKLPVDDE